MSTDNDPTVEQSIEAAHLAIMRHQYRDAQTFLEKALAVEPGNADAQRMLADLPWQHSAAPAMNGGVYDPAYDQSEDARATAIAQQAAAEENARLANMGGFGNALDPFGVPAGPFGPSYRTTPPAPVPRWVNILSLAGCIIVGTIVASVPGHSRYYPYHYSQSVGQQLHLGVAGNLIVGVVLGVILRYAPARRRRWFWW